jgi:hypothetical protein
MNGCRPRKPPGRSGRVLAPTIAAAPKRPGRQPGMRG